MLNKKIIILVVSAILFLGLGVNACPSCCEHKHKTGCNKTQHHKKKVCNKKHGDFFKLRKAVRDANKHK